MEPKLLTALVPVGASLLTVDVLQIGAELWLVPQWLESPDRKWQTPARAIRVDLLPHQRKSPQESAFGHDVTVNVSVPKAVLDGPATYAEGIQYEVVLGPAERFGRIAVPRTS